MAASCTGSAGAESFSDEQAVISRLRNMSVSFLAGTTTPYRSNFPSLLKPRTRSAVGGAAGL